MYSVGTEARPSTRGGMYNPPCPTVHPSPRPLLYVRVMVLFFGSASSLPFLSTNAAGTQQRPHRPNNPPQPSNSTRLDPTKRPCARRSSGLRPEACPCSWPAGRRPRGTSCAAPAPPCAGSGTRASRPPPAFVVGGRGRGGVSDWSVDARSAITQSRQQRRTTDCR